MIIARLSANVGQAQAATMERMFAAVSDCTGPQ
jgi:hypothetical protein